MNLELIFDEVERFLLDEGWLDNLDNWKTLDIDYHPPHVQRLYTHINSVRVCLHRILPCDPNEALVHPHPWAASFKIYKGSYYSEVGVSDTAEAPKNMMRLHLSAGSIASMTNPNDWHFVAPIKEAAYTMMINSSPYSKEEMNPGVEAASKPLSELDKDTARLILQEFKTLIENQLVD